MEEFLKNLSSPSWWATVGIGSLLLSVAGTYLVRLLDHSFLKSVEYVKFLNKKAKKRSEEIEQLKEEKAEEISQDLHEQTIISMLILKYELRIILFGIATIILAMVFLFDLKPESYLQEISLFFIVVCMLGSIYQMAKAKRWSNILAEGFKQYKENQGN